MFQIIGGIILGIVMFLGGNIFWQIGKRKQYLNRIILDEIFLQRFISSDVLLNPPARLVPYLHMTSKGYPIIIEIVTNADNKSFARIKSIFGVLVLIVLIVSYFLGTVFLIINSLLFCLSALVPISESAKRNALDHVLTLALILHRWHSENPEECAQWTKKVWTLQAIYYAIRMAEPAGQA